MGCFAGGKATAASPEQYIAKGKTLSERTAPNTTCGVRRKYKELVFHERGSTEKYNN